MGEAARDSLCQAPAHRIALDIGLIIETGGEGDSVEAGHRVGGGEEQEDMEMEKNRRRRGSRRWTKNLRSGRGI